jgi:hypothetical protein
MNVTSMNASHMGEVVGDDISVNSYNNEHIHGMNPIPNPGKYSLLLPHQIVENTPLQKSIVVNPKRCKKKRHNS